MPETPLMEQTLITGQIIHPIRDSLPQTLVREVLGTHLFGLTRRLPFVAPVLEIPEILLLLGVHGDHRLTPLLEGLHARVDELELGIAVGVRTPLTRLAIGLEAVAQIVQEQGNLLVADPVALPLQRTAH